MDVRKPTLRPPRAFSLIELILVMSIIALLMSMLLPGLQQARSKASQVVCATRIRGLNLALRSYLSQFNDTVPINGVELPKKYAPIMYDPSQTPGADPKFFVSAEQNQEKWRLEYGVLWREMGGLAPQPSTRLPLPLGDENVRKAFICPDDWPAMSRTYPGDASTSVENYPLYLEVAADGGAHVRQAAGSANAPVGPGYWSYSVNSVLNSLGRFRNRFAAGELPWNDPLHTTRVRNDSEFICFVEEDNKSLFNDEVFDPPAYNNGDLLTNRHNNYGNVGFLDGHYESYNAMIFNNVPSGVQAPDGTTLEYVNHVVPMSSPITRMFFPDGGAFVNADPTAVAGTNP